MFGAWRLRQAWQRVGAWRRLRAAQIAVAQFPAGIVRRPHGLPQTLIVSLTSYPPRYPTLAATLKSLLDQSMIADRTILWIADADLATLPADVRLLERHGLEIRRCADLRSYKKLIPALAAFPAAYLVTADDDVYYPPDWLAGLVAAVDLTTPVIVAGRAHLARFGNDGWALPYAEWELNTCLREACDHRTRLFPVGIGGIVYPPGALPHDAQDSDSFMRLCPHGDDIWFFWMARRHGVNHRRAARMLDLITWPASQASALYLENLHGGRNDQQIRAMEQSLGLVD